MQVAGTAPRRARVIIVIAAVLAVLTATTASAAAQNSGHSATLSGEGWAVELVPNANDINVRSHGGGLRIDNTSGRDTGSAGITGARGSLLTDSHRLPHRADRVERELTAEIPEGAKVLVDVRGRRPGGGWTEWARARPQTPAMLGTAVRVIQTRVTLTAAPGREGPVVRSLRLHPQLPPQGGVDLPYDNQPLNREPLRYRVFATREGLVGHTTANGHVIRPRDHFVALPSHRSLAPRGTGDYTVKVCADNGRCEFAPVWDVGPWNTRDDYWNPPRIRQSWKDLPQGVPEAQAAYLDGYNGGRDQFGRMVSNPAGIDLADGVFWDGLRLKDNSWVTVSYLWSADGPFGTVRATLLNIRTAPTTRSRAVGFAAQHAQVPVECTVTGQPIRGNQGRTDQWLRVDPHQFISAAFVTVPPAVRAC